MFVFCAIDRSSLSIQASNRSTQIKNIVSKTLCADIFSHYLVPQILDHQSLTLCADVMIFYSIFPHFPWLDTLLLATAATSSPSSMFDSLYYEIPRPFFTSGAPFRDVCYFIFTHPIGVEFSTFSILPSARLHQCPNPSSAGRSGIGWVVTGLAPIPKSPRVSIFNTNIY